jgi:hypothetical protein
VVFRITIKGGSTKQKNSLPKSRYLTKEKIPYIIFLIIILYSLLYSAFYAIGPSDQGDDIAYANSVVGHKGTKYHASKVET